MTKTRRFVTLAVLVSLGMILSYIEALLPSFVPVPGVKLGIANTVTVFLLYMLGIPEAAIVSFLRVLLSSLLFGNTVSLLYSLVGAFLSFAAMVAARWVLKLSSVGVSALGGVFHNLAQTVLAAIIFKNLAVFYYFPILIISGVIAGVVIGTAAGIIVKRLEKILRLRRK